MALEPSSLAGGMTSPKLIDNRWPFRPTSVLTRPLLLEISGKVNYMTNWQFTAFLLIDQFFVFLVLKVLMCTSYFNRFCSCLTPFLHMHFRYRWFISDIAAEPGIFVITRAMERTISRKFCPVVLSLLGFSSRNLGLFFRDLILHT